jgi:hypothetical protein
MNSFRSAILGVLVSGLGAIACSGPAADGAPASSDEASSTPVEAGAGREASEEPAPAETPALPEEAGVKVERVVYGKSALGAELAVHRITPPHANGKKALLVFGVHGFEDAWAHDGRALYAIAQRTIDHFSAHPEELGGWTAYVVPTANPDGMEHGTNNEREGAPDAYGRCTSEAEDINRNFSTSKFAEHDALKALVDDSKPSVVVDFHGWYDCYYGKSQVGDYFANAFDAKYTGKPSKYCFVKSTGDMDCGSALGGTFHRNTSITHDLFAEWASSQRGIPAALVEYPAPDFNLDGTYDTVRDAKTGALAISTSTLSLLSDRTVVALSDLFAHF